MFRSPKFTFLVRKAHNSGRNHLSNVRDYYACKFSISLRHDVGFDLSYLFLALGHDKAQNIIDQITSAYESGNPPPPGSFGIGGPPGGFPQAPMGAGFPAGFPRK